MSRLANLPVSLPLSVSITESPEKTAERFVGVFDNLTQNAFVDDATWRDSYALSGSLRTFYGAESISRAWLDCFKLNRPSHFRRSPVPPEVVQLPSGASWVEIGYVFETDDWHGTVLLSVIPDPNGSESWKIWVLRTILQQLKGCPNIDHYEPKSSTVNGHRLSNGTNHATKAKSNEDLVEPHDLSFDCIIIGAGQAGLDAAARCAALGIAYLVIDKEARIGDNWRNRYESARLHTTREYAHLPYDRTFDESYTEYLGKEDLAKGYSAYVDKMKFNIWLSTLLRSGIWDDEFQRWTLYVEKSGGFLELKSRFVILAVGAGGQIPTVPQLPGREKFRGIVLHSEEYKTSKGLGGKRGVVIGSANTAHDIAEDMLDEDVESVTMIQRSKTYVLPQEWFVRTQERIYNKHVPTDVGDMLSNTYPNAVFRLMSQATLHAFARNEPTKFQGLEKAGFRVDVFGDPAYHLFERLGGHYLDVGASAKIAAGKIKMKSDSALTHYTSIGLGFADGTELPADVVVFATGFDSNMRGQVLALFGEEVASYFGDFSVMDEEGELSGAYKFLHPGLACAGGAIGPVRWYTRLLSLTMKATLLGKPLKIYDGERRPKPILD